MNTTAKVALATSTVVTLGTALGTMEFLDDLDNHLPYIVYTGKMKKLKNRMRVCKEMAKFNIAMTTAFACGLTSYVYTGTLLNATKSIIKK